MKKPQVKRKLPSRKQAAKKTATRTKKTSSALFSIKKILVPVDFSEHSKKAVQYAASFAKQFKANLQLMFVVEPTIYPSDFAIGQLTFPNIENELHQRAEDEMENLVKWEILNGLKVEKIIKDGIPFVEVTTRAKEDCVDLIILATHGHSGVEHILFGSTAEKIVRKAPCPALVVRSDEHDFIDERV